MFQIRLIFWISVLVEDCKAQQCGLIGQYFGECSLVNPTLMRKHQVLVSLVFSSPEHEVLMVRYYDRPLSVVLIRV